MRDDRLALLREVVTALLAGAVVLGFFYFATNAMAKAQSFSEFKDLLLILNPLLGVVIGYYFQRASSERRAEAAEQTAQQATQKEAAANEARGAAERAEQDAKEIVDRIVRATGPLVDSAKPENDAATPASVWRDAETALERARTWLHR